MRVAFGRKVFGYQQQLHRRQLLIFFFNAFAVHLSNTHCIRYLHDVHCARLYVKRATQRREVKSQSGKCKGYDEHVNNSSRERRSALPD